MLPVYISYFAGKKDRPLANSIGFVIGFTVVFVTLGAFAGLIGGLLRDHATAVNIVTGALVILLGLNYIGIVRLPTPSFIKNKKLTDKPLGFVSSIIFGMVFSVTWTPCISAFLGSALLRASQQGSATEGMLMLFVFSMGLGLPFIASAVLINRLKGTFNFIKKNYRIVNGIAGSILIIVGILMITGQFGRFIALWS